MYFHLIGLPQASCFTKRIPCKSKGPFFETEFCLPQSLECVPFTSYLSGWFSLQCTIKGEELMKWNEMKWNWNVDLGRGHWRFFISGIGSFSHTILWNLKIPLGILVTIFRIPQEKAPSYFFPPRFSHLIWQNKVRPGHFYWGTQRGTKEGKYTPWTKKYII